MPQTEQYIALKIPALVMFGLGLMCSGKAKGRGWWWGFTALRQVSLIRRAAEPDLLKARLEELKRTLEAHEPDFAAGLVFRQIRGFVKRVARPRIEDGGQHHFIFQHRAGGRGDGFKCLQRIGNDAAANNNLIGCAHKIISHGCSSGGVQTRTSSVPNRFT